MSKRKRKASDYPNMTNTASATETTGMMPTPPLDSDELESYQQLSGMEVPKRRSGKGE